MVSAYNEFVKKHISSAPGANQKEKLKAVAAMWRKHKGSNEIVGGCVQKPKTKTKQQIRPKNQKKEIVAMDIDEEIIPKKRGKKQSGGNLNPLGSSLEINGNGMRGGDLTNSTDAFLYGASLPFKTLGGVLGFL